MKKIFLLIFVFIAFRSFGQFTQPQTISSPTGLLTSRGGFRADSALILPHFTDTTRANLGPGPKFYAGDLIRTEDDTLWFRNQTATRWIKIGAGSDQIFANTSDATSHTVTLSNSGGSFKLVEGTGITLTTTGTLLDGIVTIASTGIDSAIWKNDATYTANHILTADAFTQTWTFNSLAGASGIKLSSTSTAAVSNLQKVIEVSLSGANSNSNQKTYGIYVSNTHTTNNPENYGIWATSSGFGAGVFGTSDYRGVRGSSTNAAGVGVQGDASGSSGGIGVWAIGTSGAIGFQANSVNNIASASIRIPSSTNNEVAVANLERLTSGTAANGIGGSIDFYLQNDAGSPVPTNQIAWVLTDVTAGSIDSKLIFRGYTNGVGGDWLTLASGTLRLNQYGLGNFTGTPAYNLQVDASGNVIEGAVGGGAGEANTASNLGGGLANFDSKSGVDLRFNSFASADFDLASNLITIDATKWLTIAAGNSAYQPLDADLTTISGLTATTDNFIVSVASAWASRTPSQVRTTLGLVIGTNVEAWDADLDTWAGKTPYAGDLVITTGKTVTFDHTSTFTTTDGQTYTFPTTSATIARTDAANTFTGIQTFSSAPILSTGTVTVSGNTITFPAVASTLLPNTTTSGVAASPTSSSTSTITHGLGRVPTIIRIYSIGTFTSNNSATPTTFSVGTFNSTGNRCLYQAYNTAAITTTQASGTSTTFAINLQTANNSFITGVIQNVTSTTFDIVWTETGTSAAQNYMWEAQ